jgi:hypothetical protein
MGFAGEVLDLVVITLRRRFPHLTRTDLELALADIRADIDDMVEDEVAAAIEMEEDAHEILRTEVEVEEEDKAA